MSATEIKKRLSNKSASYYFHSLVVILFMSCFKYVPPFCAGITEIGMQSLGIFIGVLWGWTFVSMIWPGLLGMVAIGFTRIMTVKQSLLSGFGADLTMVTLFVFIFAAYMDESGLNSYIAKWFISRKIVIGKPWIFCFMLMTSSMIMSATTFIFATIVIVWSIFYSIADELGLKKREKFVTYILLGVSVGATMGSFLFPFNPMSVIVLGLLEKSTGIAINLAKYSVFNAVISLLIIGLYCLIGKYIFRPDVKSLSTREDRFAHFRQERMNREQKYAAVVVIVFLIMLLLPGIFPTTWPIISQLQTLGVSGSTIIVLVALMILRKKGSDGEKGYIDFSQLAKRGMNWEVIVLLAAITPISSVLESEKSGILNVAKSFLAGVISDMSPFVAIAFIALALVILTQFAHNAVLLTIFIPMLCPLVISFGIDPVLLAMTLLYVGSAAFATPGASTNVALVFANTEWTDRKDVYKYGLAASILITLVSIGLVLPLSSIFFS